MNSREAFEAHIREEFGEDWLAKNADGGYIERTTRQALRAWQAAIQHASDVAEDCIEHELGETGQAKAIFHAIKEALK